MRWCWVNFQCRDVLLIWIGVGQGPTAPAVGAGGGCLDIFTLIYPFFPLSPSLWETAGYRLKYYLKGPLSSKQPTNQNTFGEANLNIETEKAEQSPSKTTIKNGTFVLNLFHTRNKIKPKLSNYLNDSIS